MIEKNEERRLPWQHHWHRSAVFIVNFEEISHFVLFLQLFTQVNALCEWLLLRHFSCVTYNSLHVQQKQLSKHTKIGGTGDCGGGNNLVDMILFCELHLSFLGSNDLRDMILSHDSINWRFHHIAPNRDSRYNNPRYREERYWSLFLLLFSHTKLYLW